MIQCSNTLVIRKSQKEKTWKASVNHKHDQIKKNRQYKNKQMKMQYVTLVQIGTAILIGMTSGAK